MATGALSSDSLPANAATSWPAANNQSIWQAPLVPAALALTAGIVIDRHASVPLLFSISVILAALVAWAVTPPQPSPMPKGTPPGGEGGVRRTRLGRPTNLGLAYLALAGAAFGAAYHHWQRDTYAADDIGNFAATDPRPARLRGVFVEEPEIIWHSRNDPLRSFAASDTTHSVLAVSQLMAADDWLSVSGRAQLIVTGQLENFHVGDEVEVDGRLSKPESPANPGELDYASSLRDRHIQAVVHVRKTTRAVHPVKSGWAWTLTGRLAVIRGWGHRQLQEVLDAEYSPVATALLLGEGTAMTAEGWEKYVRSGVVHVLIISGQHLMILSAFLWGVLRLAGIRRRQGAWMVGLFLLSYALMTGGRPPVMRAAVIMGVFCLAVYLRRPALSANSLALAWIVVALLNPTDLFTTGCQLSFLAVAILYWGTGRWFYVEQDPLQRLIAESRPPWLQALHWVGKRVLQVYAITWIVLLLQTPLVASRAHLISPIGFIIGPIVIFLTFIALIAGFLLLLSCFAMKPLAPLFAVITEAGLSGCDTVVTWSDQLTWGHWYVGDVPTWWLLIFYPALLLVLTHQPLRARWRWATTAGIGWLCVGLIAGSSRPTSDELRCTMVAVGHGGCTVLEMPDGRTVLYDAGAMNGPDVTRRQIAPFLWSRGIRRIDEVILSHADLDHFNGLPALLERFPVGQMTSTQSFADKSTPGVRETLAALDRFHIPLRIVEAGQRLSAGEVEIEVLHPQGTKPEGKENFRSLVLLIEHADHRLLLTGDLEGPGLARVVNLPPPRIDVLMAPHHGSRAGDQLELTNRTNLALRTHPSIIISCQGLPRSSLLRPDPYAASGAQYLGTWPHGAITIRSSSGQLDVETFRTRQRLTLRSE